MAYNDKVVDVTVDLGTQPITTEGFETPLFVSIHNAFAERQRIYGDTDSMVADGFAPGSPAYIYATKAFAGKFPPQYIRIGRMGLVNTVIDFTGQSNIDPTVPVGVNVVSGNYSTSFVLPVTAESTPASLATALVAAISADTTLDDVLTATAGTAADAGKVTVVAANGGLFSIGKDQGNYVVTSTTNETFNSVIPAINASSSDWYFLTTESHADATILAAAAYASTNYKLHVYSSQDAGIPANEDDSIAAQLKALAYDTSIGMYDPTADTTFPEAGIIGAMASNDPSYGDSIHLKIMSGVVAPELTLTQRANIWGQNVNFYRTINGVGAFWEGKVASGQYVDVIRFGHWMKYRTEESLFAYMSRRSNLGLSVKMSDDDLPNLKSVMMNSPINTGIANGAILTGYDETNKVFYDPVITIPTRSSIPSNDLATRTLNNVKVEVVYNGALHFIKIRITVLLDKTGSATSTGQTTTATV
ncbi:hypothetical protein pEaSNUABM56_00113 [Erwinia phage pEa_SNUABM_56]|uniref:Putative tail sheath protein n=1 Tax=Erwinia phage pEp_SNUABM_01 TaxID=2601643 RepID=A0A5J6DAK0_9CAUD|nr:tail sheath [Erwinia phage pEp_SNUABM_01]QEQ94912.1 putative tail sheath protein [Erwinia phage pEp_SNUABM_01]UYL84842.1 hypothetical protein pEaSNUABM55_00044 [Erwinia phage pEa_SNUABM_55]UYL85158.1 hypothetical protein pEaSNUABM56_00113 [Erwinia phage pEa_SNUABM_56]